MNSQPKKCWLPRFGLKTLFALVLVVAAYFGSWPWLREGAIRDVEAVAVLRLGSVEHVSGDYRQLLQTRTVAPFLLSAMEDAGGFGRTGRPRSRRNYYLWLFGWTVRLPFTTPV